jgi:hypothetical protein
MNKVVATFALIGLTAAVSACDTTGSGNVETAAPYALERTANGGDAAMNEQVAAPATEHQIQGGEKVFHKAQTK